MKKVWTGLAALLLSTSLWAAETQQIKIGVVDWRVALFQTDAAKAENAKMQKANGKMIDRAKELERLIDANNKSLDKDSALLSTAEKDKIERELDQQLQEFDMVRFRLRDVQTKTEAQFVASQHENIDKAIRNLADKHELDVVLDRNAVVYGREVRSLTNDLVTELNKLQ